MKFEVHYSQETLQGIRSAKIAGSDAHAKAVRQAIADAYEASAQALAKNDNYLSIIMKGTYPVAPEFLAAAGLWSTVAYSNLAKNILLDRVKQIRAQANHRHAIHITPDALASALAPDPTTAAEIEAAAAADAAAVPPRRDVPLANGLTKLEMAGRIAAAVTPAPAPTAASKSWFTRKNVFIALALTSFLLVAALTFGGVIPVASFFVIGPLYNAIAGSGTYTLSFGSLGLLSIPKVALAVGTCLTVGAAMVSALAWTLTGVAQAMINTLNLETATPAGTPSPQPSLTVPGGISSASVSENLLSPILSPSELDALLGKYLKATLAPNLVGLVGEHYSFRLLPDAQENSRIRAAMNEMAQYVVVTGDTYVVKDREKVDVLRGAFTRDFGYQVTHGMISVWGNQTPATGSLVRLSQGEAVGAPAPAPAPAPAASTSLTLG